MEKEVKRKKIRKEVSSLRNGIERKYKKKKIRKWIVKLIANENIKERRKRVESQRNKEVELRE